MKLQKIESGVYHVKVDGKYVGRVYRQGGRFPVWVADNGVAGRYSGFARRYQAVAHVLAVANVPLESR
jgi:hypothetical protein